MGKCVSQHTIDTLQEQYKGKKIVIHQLKLLTHPVPAA